ncbi:hypothetical protein MSPP1_003832 [Malassezia sp. CBS 17886]|nr:hypothetical protein MSPP1_003832 [Malassezia sp. CBS 17886]
MGPQHAPPARLSRKRTVVLPLLLSFLAFLVAALYPRRFVVQMATSSFRDVLPDFWVLPASPGARCHPVVGEPAPDPRAYATSPTDPSVHVQLPLNCEDVKLSRRHGIAVFACDPSRPVWNPVMGPLLDPSSRGAVWIQKYEHGDGHGKATAVPLDDFPEDYDYHPLGLALYETSPTSVRLFSVNLGTRASTIEVIDLTVTDAGEWRGRYVRTIAHPLATQASNSITPLSATELLVTNMHMTMRRPPPLEQTKAMLRGLYGTWAERLLAVPVSSAAAVPVMQVVENVIGTGWVAHVTFDDKVTMPAHSDLQAFARGVDARVLTKGIPFANGIGLSPGLKNVVVSSTTSSGVYVYPVQRWTKSGKPDWNAADVLGAPLFIPAPFLSDNVEVAPPLPGEPVLPDDPLDGAAIYVAGHPSLKDLEEMIAAPGQLESMSGTWVAEIKYTGKTVPDERPPVHAERFLPGTPPGWSVRTLLQTNGQGFVDENGVRVTIPAGSGTAWDRSRKGHGSFFVTGLYSPAPLLCTGRYK